jgi:DNA-binding XRE family transcriptional regulator
MIAQEFTKLAITKRFCLSVRRLVETQAFNAKTLKEVCKTIGLHQQSFVNLEREKQCATIHHITNLCLHYPVDVRYIMLNMDLDNDANVIAKRIRILETNVNNLNVLTSHKLVTEKPIKKQKTQ